jgi:hypothetical protein
LKPSHPFKSLLAAGLAAFLAGCLTDGSSDSNTNAQEALPPLSYTQVGDAIITAAYQDTDVFCRGDSLARDVEERPADTVGFAIAGKILTVFPPPEILEASGAMIQWTTTYTRVGGGSGLTGDWRQNDQSYTVNAGELDESEKRNADLRVASTRRLLEYTLVTVRFANGKISVLRDGDNSRRFIDDWNNGFGEDTDLADSALYDITVRALDRKTVELKGKKTGETVRIVIRENGDRTYTGSGAGHGTFQYYDTPRSCPEVYYPAWFPEFEQANAKDPLP